MKLPNLKPEFDKLLSKASPAFDRKGNSKNKENDSLPSGTSYNFDNLSASKFIKYLESLKLKVKIRLALVVLFAAITLLGMLGGYYVQRTSNDAILMIRDNHNTVNYVMEMYKAMNDMVYAITLESSAESFRRQAMRKATDNFEAYLNLQLDKVSGKEEQELTARLNENYEAFRDDMLHMDFTSEVPVPVYMKIIHIQSLLQSVHELNERMIDQRIQEAGEVANRVTMYMVVLGFFFFVFALFAMFYFPHYITEPIQSMTRSIQQISRKTIMKDFQ